MADLKPGDHVIDTEDRENAYTVRDIGEQFIDVATANSFIGRSLVLVGRPHYAPEGVPMIAMTPERIAALAETLLFEENRLSVVTFKPGIVQINARLQPLRDMLAESRGEVKP